MSGLLRDERHQATNTTKQSTLTCSNRTCPTPRVLSCIKSSRVHWEITDTEERSCLTYRMTQQHRNRIYIGGSHSINAAAPWIFHSCFYCSLQASSAASLPCQTLHDAERKHLFVRMSMSPIDPKVAVLGGVREHLYQDIPHLTDTQPPAHHSAFACWFAKPVGLAYMKWQQPFVFKAVGSGTINGNACLGWIIIVLWKRIVLLEVWKQ